MEGPLKSTGKSYQSRAGLILNSISYGYVSLKHRLVSSCKKENISKSHTRGQHLNFGNDILFARHPVRPALYSTPRCPATNAVFHVLPLHFRSAGLYPWSQPNKKPAGLHFMCDTAHGNELCISNAELHTRESNLCIAFRDLHESRLKFKLSKHNSNKSKNFLSAM